MDGVWSLIVRAFVQPGNPLLVFWEWVWPHRFKLDERQRRLHSFVVGRTGAGKSVMLHHFIRHYLRRAPKTALVLLDPHGDLANVVARDKCLKGSDRLVYVCFDQIADRSIHFNPFDLPQGSEDHINRAQLQFAGAVEKIIGEPFIPFPAILILRNQKQHGCKDHTVDWKL